MKEFIMKYKIQIAAAVLAIAAVLVIAVKLSGKGGGSERIAYVDTVESLTGQNASLGMVNRFSGVVEPQGLWSVSKNNDVDVKEIFVEVGDEVSEGDPLFEYDTLKYEEDLNQGEIELERLRNEYESTEETIAQLEKEKKQASSSEQANYTIQIKEQNLSLKDKELDIAMKEAEIAKLEENIDNAVVTSAIDGVVKTINENGSDSDDNSFITVMKTGTFRVKGTVNEQNVGELTTDARVIVHSRVNDRTWKGQITKIDTENAVSNENNGIFGSSGGGNKSTKYPFYVELDSSEGLIMGQHVYVEVDLGQEDEDNTSGIWIASYMVDQTDPEHPFVWKDVKGRLQKQEVTIGDVREEIGKVKIIKGLTLQDSICIPDPSLEEGMKTAPMSEKPQDEAGDSGNEEDTVLDTDNIIDVEGENSEGKQYSEQETEDQGMEDQGMEDQGTENQGMIEDTVEFDLKNMEAMPEEQ